MALANTGSVRDAAIELYVSQPAISAAISALQQDLGVPLTERVGRGIQLTPAGQTMATYARQILGLMDEARVAAQGQADPSTGLLRLAAVTTAGEALIPGWLGSFKLVYPRVEVSLEVGNRNRLWGLLENREVDIAVGGRPPLDGRRLATLAVRPHELIIVAAPSTKGLREVRSVQVEDLAQRPWLVREPGSGTRLTTDELLLQLRIEPSLLTLSSNRAIREAVAVGLGIALLSRDTIARELSEGLLAEWHCAPIPFHRHWHFAVRAGEPLPGPAQLFIDHVTQADELVNVIEYENS